MDDLLVEYTRRRGINSEGLALLPKAAAGCWPNSGRTLAAAEAQASGLMASLNRTPASAEHAAFTIASQQAVWEVRESSLV